MKRLVKHAIITCTICCINFFSFCQSTNGTGANGFAANRYLGWDASNGTNPLYFKTNNVFRMKLNATTNYPYNGFAGQRDGYLLLGATSNDNFTNIAKGAASILHLNGRYNTNFQPEVGYRPWMQTGITLTDNDDLSYFGLRRIGYETDLTKSITETTVCWSNDGVGQFGPDDMSFRFLFGAAAPNGSTINNDLLANDDLDGLHIGRFTDLGLFGLGNTFGVNDINGASGLYVRPQSLLHMSYSNNYNIWSQYTNRGTNATGEAITDGLRIGILGSTTAGINGTAAIYNQELNPILMSTNANTTTLNPATGATQERVRITSTNTPTNVSNGVMGQFNPGAIANNITRVSISHDPSNPVTKPLSLLHLGYNSATTLTATDGWRSWMDVGMFVSNKTDHVYLGLKNETANPSFNRQDAVLGWGDDPTNAGSNGPDNLRFIFTSASTTVQTPASNANSVNGLEVARMEPTAASTLPGNYGMMGIGNFSPASGSNVDAKLDIDGDLRIRTVVNDNNLTQVLVVDPNDRNRVHYRDASTLTGGTSIGNYCSAPQNNLTGNFEVPLTGNYNYYFSGANTSSVGIGWACNSSLKAKIDVIDNTKGIAGDFNTNGTTFGTGQAVMAHAYASGIGNIGVQGYATSTSGPFNYGILGYANGATINRAGYFSGDLEYTGAFISSDQQLKTNIEDIPSALSIVKSLDAHSYYMDTVNFNQFSFDSNKQYGFIAQELEIVLPELVHNSYNPGIKDSTGAYIAQPLSYKSVNYNAIIPINTQAIKELNLKVDKQTLSDQSIKTNVNNLTGSLEKVLAMRGVSFNWNQNLQPQFQLDNSNHVGFIAQEINAVDPRLTFMGDENLMHVDYDKIVPIAVEAIQELNSQITQRDSIINSLNDRLTHLESCLSGILPFLCQISHNSIQPTQQEFQQQLKKEIDVQLSNKGTIILNQNVPNPFAEQTQISFSIPETVKKAQIHFYDANGKLINSVEVQERGLGQLNVFANDLSTGMYTYTLVADGQIVATKKMMKQ